MAARNPNITAVIAAAGFMTGFAAVSSGSRAPASDPAGHADIFPDEMTVTAQPVRSSLYDGSRDASDLDAEQPGTGGSFAAAPNIGRRAGNGFAAGVSDAGSGGWSYPNCRAARAAGAAPIYAGQTGYGPHLDGDHDGIACEPYHGR